jgi:hypothetical protein
LKQGRAKSAFSPGKALKVQTFSSSYSSSARKKEKYTSALKYIEFRKKSQYKTAIFELLVKTAKMKGASLAVPPLDREKRSKLE